MILAKRLTTSVAHTICFGSGSSHGDAVTVMDRNTHTNGRPVFAFYDLATDNSVETTIELNTHGAPIQDSLCTTTIQACVPKHDLGTSQKAIGTHEKCA